MQLCSYARHPPDRCSQKNDTQQWACWINIRIGSYRELRKYGIDMNMLKQFISFYIYFRRQGFIFLDFLIQKVEHSQNRISESLIINCHGFSSTRLEKKLLLPPLFSGAHWLINQSEAKALLLETGDKDISLWPAKLGVFPGGLNWQGCRFWDLVSFLELNV